MAVAAADIEKETVEEPFCDKCRKAAQNFYWARKGEDVVLFCEKCAKQSEPDEAKLDAAKAKEFCVPGVLDTGDVDQKYAHRLAKRVQAELNTTRLEDGDNHLCYCMATKVRKVLDQWATDVLNSRQPQRYQLERMTRLWLCFGMLSRDDIAMNISPHTIKATNGNEQDLLVRLAYDVVNGKAVFGQGELVVPSEYLPTITLDCDVFGFSNQELKAKLTFDISYEPSFFKHVTAQKRVVSTLRVKYPEINQVQPRNVQVIAEQVAPAPAAAPPAAAPSPQPPTAAAAAAASEAP